MLKKVVKQYHAMSVQVRASLWFLICGFLEKGISLITTPIFTRLLTTEEYGKFGVFNSWMGIASVIITLNLFSGVFTQGLVKLGSKKRPYASSLQGLCFTLCCFWTILYILLHDFWNQLFSLTTVQMLAMILMIWTSAAFNFWSVTQRVDLKYKALVAVTLVVTIAKPVLGVVCVLYSEDKVTARILGLLVVQLIFYSWTFFYQMAQGRKFFSAEYWKGALIANLPLIPHYLSLTLLNSSDRIMIENMVGLPQAGVYNLAYSISMIMLIFNTAMMRTIEPWLYERIKAQEIEKISVIAYPAFVLIAGLNIMLMLFAPEVVAVFAPVQYYESIWVIPPVAMSVFFMFLYTFFAAFEFYFQKTKYIMIATTLGAAANIVLNAIFIPIFGYYAAGYTTLICYGLIAAVHYILMNKICNQYLDGEKPYDTKKILLIIGVFSAGAFVILMTYQYTAIRYGMVVVGLILVIWKRDQLWELLKQQLQLTKRK